MLSGEFTSVPISSILWNRDERIRKEITPEDVEVKMKSIAARGLMHPLIITREYEGVAGETRWLALRALGWTEVPIQWADTLDKHEMLAIEIEENIKRKNLDWEDECASYLRFHELMKEMHGEAWTIAQSADEIGVSWPSVQQKIAVAKELASGNERVRAAGKLSTAIGITTRQSERRKADELASLKVDLENPNEAAAAEPVEPSSPFLCADFNEWIKTYRGPPFNFLHCDLPYGINADKFNQGAADSFGGYEDTPETYWRLINSILENLDTLLGDSGHILFWFSMRYYQETLEALRKRLWVDPYPIVWHKNDNKGTLPDSQRGPRRVYEVAFLASHGDRKIIQAVSNVFAAPTVRLGEHMSEKSEDMLKHFMRMLVDENTRMLDPTAGSGSSLRAARALGATNLLGLEINPEFVENAKRAWKA